MNIRSHVFRKRGTRYHPDHIILHDRSGRVTANVWAWFCATGPGDLVWIPGRFNQTAYLELLEQSFLPSIKARFGDQPVFIVQDLCAIHWAKSVKQWFAEHPQLQLLPWPPKGADMNPIENHWANMVRDIGFIQCKTSAELANKVTECWVSYAHKTQYWEKLVNSMPSRLQEVISANGCLTSY